MASTTTGRPPAWRRRRAPPRRRAPAGGPRSAGWPRGRRRRAGRRRPSTRSERRRRRRGRCRAARRSRCGSSAGRRRAIERARVRSPQPVQRSGSTSRSTYRAALSSSAMPDHSACPGFVVSESMGRPSASRPRTNQPRRSQKTSLNRPLSSSARRRRSVARWPMSTTSASDRGALQRGVHVALDLDQRQRGGRQRAVCAGDAVPRVLPPLVGEPARRRDGDSRRTRRRRSRPGR